MDDNDLALILSHMRVQLRIANEKLRKYNHKYGPLDGNSEKKNVE